MHTLSTDPHLGYVCITHHQNLKQVRKYLLMNLRVFQIPCALSAECNVTKDDELKPKKNLNVLKVYTKLLQEWRQTDETCKDKD